MFFLLFSTKFVKLPSLSESRIDKLFDSNSWCVSYLGSYLDVPENTKASIDYVSSHIKQQNKRNLQINRSFFN